MRKVLLVAAAIIVASPGVYFVFKFAESLSTFEKIATILFPVVLGLAFFVISDFSMQRALQSHHDVFLKKFSEVLSSASDKRAKIYETKKTVPGGSDYWNDLCKSTDKDLFIIGTTNKSWFNKDENQSRRLLAEFLRIKKAGGRVRIVSVNRKQTTEMMKHFVQKYCSKPQLSGVPFDFFVLPSLTYGAVLTDEKLVLMPLPMEETFREETAVFEIDAISSPQVFRNYKADIERLVQSATKQTLM